MRDIRKDDILTRIRKLLALARGGATEAEAAEATRLAHALLATHNLRLDDIERTRAERVIDGDTVDGSRELWPVYVWHGATGLYFCDYFYSRIVEPGPPERPIGLRHTFVGRPHNVKVAKLMGDYLVATVQRLAREHGRGVDAGERVRFRESFRLACAGRLAERLWARRRETEKRESPCPGATTLPALAPLYEAEARANRALLEQRGIHLSGKGEDPGRITHAGGAEAGAKAADEIGLEPQIGCDPRASGRASFARSQLSFWSPVERARLYWP